MVNWNVVSLVLLQWRLRRTTAARGRYQRGSCCCRRLVTPTPKREQRARWHSDEMMPLYRLCHSIGSNAGDWETIVATGEIPNKTGQQMSSKWQTANKTPKYNPLEKAFCDAKAKVAKQIGDVKVVGTVTDYVMDEKSREGTWTIVWGDGTAGPDQEGWTFCCIGPLRRNEEGGEA